VAKILLLMLATGLVGLAAAAASQHLRYLGIRRGSAEDRQPLLYGRSAFHTMTLLKVAAHEGRAGELAALRALREAIETPGGGTVVYAGLVAMTMVPSSQLGNDWSAVAIAQYPSRDAFEQNRRSPAVERALGASEQSHVHGFERPALRNLLIPVGLGIVRLVDIVRRRDPILPFEPVKDDDALSELVAKRKELVQLDAYRDVREDAVVILNLLLPGTAEQRAADRAYGYQMVRGMAEGGYGPMHMGRAVTVEGDSRFRSFAAVYYPGIDHMHAMLGSTFMNRIGADKQLGDTLAVATIPVLSDL
jgi:hypothetical protein